MSLPFRVAIAFQLLRFWQAPADRCAQHRAQFSKTLPAIKELIVEAATCAAKGTLPAFAKLCR